MELEELQKAWKELNERVSQNELVHQQQIIEMLSRQKESCLQRMLRMDKIASIFMLGVTILMFVDFIHLNGKLVFWPAIFGLLLYALTVNFAGVILLTKIKKETNLEMQIKNILPYGRHRALRLQRPQALLHGLPARLSGGPVRRGRQEVCCPRDRKSVV